MEKKDMLSLAEKLILKAIPALFNLIKDAVDGGEASAEKLRKQPIKISVAFGGEDGEAYSAQVELEADLPDE